mgnify:CR=1 FL=1
MKHLIDQLRRDEGEVLHAYSDHLGYLTIGVGRLIDKRKGGGITQAEAAYLLQNDIDRVSSEIFRRIPWAETLDQARLGVLIAMAFQMGVDGLLKFKTTLKRIQERDYAGASQSMLDSLWAQQTPARAKRLSQQILTGVWK